MRKLKLDADELGVETFEVVSGPSRAGTVAGASITFDPTACYKFTCAVSCAVTCLGPDRTECGTCAPMCARTEFTCEE